MRYTHNNDIHPIFFSSKERNKGFALNKRTEKERINEKNMGCDRIPGASTNRVMRRRRRRRRRGRVELEDLELSRGPSGVYHPEWTS